MWDPGRAAEGTTLCLSSANTGPAPSYGLPKAGRYPITPLHSIGNFTLALRGVLLGVMAIWGDSGAGLPNDWTDSM